MLVRIQSFKSVRWLENFSQPAEFIFSMLKNQGKKRVLRAC